MSRIGAQSLNRNDHQLAHNTVFFVEIGRAIGHAHLSTIQTPLDEDAL
jgi:hypothetical protein